MSSFDIAVEPLNPPGGPPGPTFGSTVGPSFTFDCASEFFVLTFEAERRFASACSDPAGRLSTDASEGVDELPIYSLGDEREAVNESSNSARNASITFFANAASLFRGFFDREVDTARPADSEVIVSTASFGCADWLASFSFGSDEGFCGILLGSAIGALGKLFVAEGGFPIDTASGIAGGSRRSGGAHTSEDVVC